MPACVLIDKLDKQTPASLAPEFAALGLDQSTVDQLLQHLQVRELFYKHLCEPNWSLICHNDRLFSSQYS